MTLPFFRNRKSRRELEAEIKSLVETRDVKLEMHHNTATKSVAELERVNDLLKNERKMYEKASKERDELADQIEEIQKAPKPLAKIELVPSLNLTLAKWLKEENLIASAAKILQHPDLRAMLDVLRNEHPGRKGLAISATMEQRAAWQAETQGYERCLAYLLAMGEKPTVKKQIEETFAEENVTGGRK